MSLPRRSESALRQRQRRGELRVRSAGEFQKLVREAGLKEAYHDTDVVVAADAGFTDQASLHLHLGPTDPPIRLRDPVLADTAGLALGGSGDIVLPISQGGAQALAELLSGASVPFQATGEPSLLQPRREVAVSLDLERIGAGRLHLHRAIGENGLVAVSSREGILRTPFGPLLGPFANALYSCGGATSIGLAMPGLSLLGPGSPVLVGGALGWVVGAGSGHQPRPRRLASGHARTPGAVAAVSVDLHELGPDWIRPCRFEGQGTALLVPIAAAIPLIDEDVARRASISDGDVEAPVLDLSVPRRVKPSFGGVSYADLLAGRIEVEGRHLAAAPSHSPRLAAAIGEELIRRLRDDRFPLRLPLRPLGERPGLLPLDA